MLKSVGGCNLRCWMLVSQLGYIFKNKVDRNEGVKWFIDEINYCLENDEFRS